jgi:DNA-binding XRE family transcriptional regulator
VLRCENRLRVTLEQRRLSRTDLATLSGLPYTTVLRLVRARGNPPLEQALRISAVLDIPVEKVFWLRVNDVRRLGRRRVSAA